jgi:hypothetical protein
MGDGLKDGDEIAAPYGPAEFLGSSLGPLCVLQEQGNGPIAFLLMRGILKHVDLAASTPAAPVAR